MIARCYCDVALRVQCFLQTVVEAQLCDVVGGPCVMSACLTIDTVVGDGVETLAPPSRDAAPLAKAPSTRDAPLAAAAAARGKASAAEAAATAAITEQALFQDAPTDESKSAMPATEASAPTCVMMHTMGVNAPCLLMGAAAFAVQGKLYLHGGVEVLTHATSLWKPIIDINSTAFSKAELARFPELRYLRMRHLLRKWRDSDTESGAAKALCAVLCDTSSCCITSL